MFPDDAQPYPPKEPMRPRDMMSRDGYQDNMRDTGRDYNDMHREPQREMLPGPRRETRSDFGRDIRRDYGRDMRSDTGRGRDYDDYSGMGRLDREPMQPMREMDRRYPQDSTSYDDHDQNLLPPVASLM